MPDAGREAALCDHHKDVLCPSCSPSITRPYESREATDPVERVARALRRHFHAGGHPDDYVAPGHDRNALTCQWCWESAEVAVEAMTPPARETTAMAREQT